MFGLGLGLTSGALGLLHAASPVPHPGLELSVLVLANLAATVLRFVLLRVGYSVAMPGQYSMRATLRPGVRARRRTRHVRMAREQSASGRKHGSSSRIP